MALPLSPSVSTPPPDADTFQHKDKLNTSLGGHLGKRHYPLGHTDPLTLSGSQLPTLSPSDGIILACPPSSRNANAESEVSLRLDPLESPYLKPKDKIVTPYLDHYRENTQTFKNDHHLLHPSQNRKIPSPLYEEDLKVVIGEPTEYLQSDLSQLGKLHLAAQDGIQFLPIQHDTSQTSLMPSNISLPHQNQPNPNPSQSYINHRQKKLQKVFDSTQCSNQNCQPNITTFNPGCATASSLSDLSTLALTHHLQQISEPGNIPETPITVQTQTKRFSIKSQPRPTTTHHIRDNNNNNTSSISVQPITTHHNLSCRSPPNTIITNTINPSHIHQLNHSPYDRIGLPSLAINPNPTCSTFQSIPNPRFSSGTPSMPYDFEIFSPAIHPPYQLDECEYNISCNLYQKFRGGKGEWSEISAQEPIRVTKGVGKKLKLHIQSPTHFSEPDVDLTLRDMSHEQYKDKTQEFNLTSSCADLGQTKKNDHHIRGFAIENIQIVNHIEPGPTSALIFIKLFRLSKHLEFHLSIRVNSPTSPFMETGPVFLHGKTVMFDTHNSGKQRPRKDFIEYSSSHGSKNATHQGKRHKHAIEPYFSMPSPSSPMISKPAFQSFYPSQGQAPSDRLFHRYHWTPPLAQPSDSSNFMISSDSSQPNVPKSGSQLYNSQKLNIVAGTGANAGTGGYSEATSSFPSSLPSPYPPPLASPQHVSGLLQSHPHLVSNASSNFILSRSFPLPTTLRHLPKAISFEIPLCPTASRIVSGLRSFGQKTIIDAVRHQKCTIVVFIIFHYRRYFSYNYTIILYRENSPLHQEVVVSIDEPLGKAFFLSPDDEESVSYTTSKYRLVMLANSLSYRANLPIVGIAVLYDCRWHHDSPSFRPIQLEPHPFALNHSITVVGSNRSFLVQDHSVEWIDTARSSTDEEGGGGEDLSNLFDIRDDRISFPESMNFPNTVYPQPPLQLAPQSSSSGLNPSFILQRSEDSNSLNRQATVTYSPTSTTEDRFHMPYNNSYSSLSCQMNSSLSNSSKKRETTSYYREHNTAKSSGSLRGKKSHSKNNSHLFTKLFNMQSKSSPIGCNPQLPVRRSQPLEDEDQISHYHHRHHQQQQQPCAIDLSKSSGNASSAISSSLTSIGSSSSNMVNPASPLSLSVTSSPIQPMMALPQIFPPPQDNDAYYASSHYHYPTTMAAIYHPHPSHFLLQSNHPFPLSPTKMISHDQPFSSSSTLPFNNALYGNLVFNPSYQNDQINPNLLFNANTQGRIPFSSHPCPQVFTSVQMPLLNENSFGYSDLNPSAYSHFHPSQSFQLMLPLFQFITQSNMVNVDAANNVPQRKSPEEKNDDGSSTTPL